jgi:hypothetical protein
MNTETVLFVTLCREATVATAWPGVPMRLRHRPACLVRQGFGEVRTEMYPFQGKNWRGGGPLSREQAVLAGQLLGVHWTTVYRLRRRFLADPVASSVAPYRRGPSTGGGRLRDDVDKVIDEVVHVWLPRQRQLAHPATDLVLEVRRRCALAGLQLPSRTTIGRRWARHRESDAVKRAALPTP